MAGSSRGLLKNHCNSALSCNKRRACDSTTLLFHGFVGLEIEDEVQDHVECSKDRDLLFSRDVVQGYLAQGNRWT